VPTTFNFLGPLANPAQPIATALGVSNATIAPLMAQELALRGRSGLVFRSADGLDEISVTASTTIWQVSQGEVSEHEVSRFVDPIIKIEQLLGGDAKHNAEVALNLFDGETQGNYSAIKQVVLLNAAAGIASYELAKTPQLANVNLADRLEAGFEKARAALEGGLAHSKVTEWSHATQTK
jgi:anthranilate phosphoribosyltransferase